MSTTVNLPEDVVARLRAEAARRGVPVESVIAELAAQLPLEAEDADGATPRRPLSFAGTLSAEPDLAERAEQVLDEIVRRNAG